MLSLEGDALAGALKRVIAEHGANWGEFAALLRVREKSQGRSPAEYARIEESLEIAISHEGYVWPMLRCYQSAASQQQGDLTTADFHLREARRALAQLDSPILQDICTPNIEQVEGCLARRRGDFKSAARLFRSAIRGAENHQIETEPIAQYELASLLWASGQFREALDRHTSEEVRARIAKLLGPTWLLRSHLSAAKCAIDLGDADVAARELQAAGQLQRETERVPIMLPGYALLYSGELAGLRGDLPGAYERFEGACRHFESMAPPFYAGLLEAKIAIARHAISQNDPKRLFPVIHKLLAECDEKGCIEARARLLVLESALFVSENPPLREAYDDLVTRMHLIQNPALMLQALANLFVHSLRYLDTPDQAFLMARLRRLQQVLEEPHFQDLYEQYIEKRYHWAIENRLAEFLEDEESLLADEGEPEKA